LGKGTGGQAFYRTTDSLAFVTAARAAFLVTRDKQDANRRLFLPIKEQLGPDATGMAYRIEEVGEVPRVVWEEETIELSTDDALRLGETDGHETTLADGAAEWLRESLSTGPVASNDVRLEAKEAGYSWATVRRGQEKLGINPQRLEKSAGRLRGIGCCQINR
jgi:putative DNA primase/helicase